MSLKKTAEDLLKIAEDIEKEAAEVTQFVCDKCNHTATLAKINASRKDAAKEAGEEVTVSDVTVNDKISCPACDGIMSFKQTEASSPYYFDEKKAEEKEEPKEEEPKEEKKEEKEAKEHSEKTETPEEEAAESLETQKKEREKGKHASIDYDQLDRYLKG